MARRFDSCQLCHHDEKFREGRTHCAHCVAGKAKALGWAEVGGKKGKDKNAIKPDTAGKQSGGKGKSKGTGKGDDWKSAKESDAEKATAMYKELSTLRSEVAELRAKAKPLEPRKDTSTPASLNRRATSWATPGRLKRTLDFGEITRPSRLAESAIWRPVSTATSSHMVAVP